MISQLFSRHAYNCSSRSKHFKTAPIATLTPRTDERIHGRVANLTRRAVSAAPQFTIQNDTATHPCAERDANHAAMPARRTQPHLTDSSGVGIILENDGPAELTFQYRFQRYVIQTREIRHLQNRAIVFTNGPRNHDRRPTDQTGVDAFFAGARSSCLHKGAHNTCSISIPGRPLFTLRVNSALFIDKRDTKMCAAKISSEDQVPISRSIHNEFQRVRSIHLGWGKSGAQHSDGSVLVTVVS